MKTYTVMRFCAVASATILMAACSHPQSATTTSFAAQSSNTKGSAASSYGLANNGGYQINSVAGNSQSNGFHVNALSAPTNQTYYFGFDSNQLQASDQKALAIQANYLASHPSAHIRLEGNTDNRGSREYNVGLGWRRDQAVEHYFTQRGVSVKQIQMVSYGKEHPAVSGSNAKAWALNRRVNLIYKAS